MELLVQASIIMVLGMAVTSLFIGIVIGGVSLSARIIHRAGAASTEVKGGTTPPSATMDNGRIVAAIAAALLRKPED
jgi:Na+-transporting methylmalonyl-CoA/oxaloacetate decarboxylase gamma subunit